MQRIFFSISALLCVLVFAPFASAQQSINDNNDFVIENFCIPDSPQEFGEPVIFSGLDFRQLERVRIELLERGFDPGFDPNWYNTIDSQLMEALAQFQAANELSVTGHPDTPTLTALSVPVPEIQSPNF